MFTSGEIDENTQVEKVDILSLIRDQITMKEARTALSDESAEALVEDVDIPEELPAEPEEREELPVSEDEEPKPRKVAEKKPVAIYKAGKSKRGTINIDTLSKAFAPNDVINIEVLKERGMLPKKVMEYKVLARGMLNKPLIVEANEFSLDAVKMIVLTGGKVRRIHRL